jgi:acetyl-CoA C-acetyltransferase
MKYAAPIADEYGASLEDTAKALGVLANMQIKGSMAGTSLRMIFMKLADPAVREQLRAMDVDLSNIGDTMIGIGRAMAKMSRPERLAFAKEFFDQRAAAAVVKLAKSDFPALAEAIDNGRLDEIEPIYDNDGNLFESDDGLRRDSSMEKLAKLKPVFDRPVGKVTAGNSAQITDGAAMLVLASEKAVEEHDLPVLGRIIDSQWSALDPSQMGLGPVHAMGQLLKRQQMKGDEVEYWEINEAFAAQVLACQAAWQDADYMRQEVGLDELPAPIPDERLNVNGGAVSIGHPVGASGARLVLHLLKTLQQNQAKRGIASLCIGGGQGGAMLVETAS